MQNSYNGNYIDGKSDDRIKVGERHRTRDDSPTLLSTPLNHPHLHHPYKHDSATLLSTHLDHHHLHHPYELDGVGDVATTSSTFNGCPSGGRFAKVGRGIDAENRRRYVELGGTDFVHSYVST